MYWSQFRPGFLEGWPFTASQENCDLKVRETCCTIRISHFRRYSTWETPCRFEAFDGTRPPRHHFFDNMCVILLHTCLEFIEFWTAEFLIVITKRELKGQICGHNIYRATGFELLPLQSVATSSQVTERYLLSLVKSNLNSSLLWFSYDWDLTRRLQAQYVARPGDVGKALWESVRRSFYFWLFVELALGRWPVLLE